LLEAVRQALHPYRRIGHDLSVASAVLVPVDLALAVEVGAEYVAGHVRAELLRVLGAGVRSDGRPGFFHPGNLTFGTPIRVSQIIAAVAAVPGVRHSSASLSRPLRRGCSACGRWRSRSSAMTRCGRRTGCSPWT
jgi:hypothetical protein